MLKLFNLSNHEVDVAKFGGDRHALEAFVEKYGFDGIELIQAEPWKEDVIPARLVKGMHMRFWPLWLDFWNGDEKKLLESFGSMETVCLHYGGTDRKAMVDWYKKEVRMAAELKAEYVVFHISNVMPEHCFSYQFTYTDEEVIEAGIELLNEVMDQEECKFKLLVENLWWPGLNFIRNEMTRKLIEGIKHPNKGFMLDISHIMNTNLELQSEDEGVEFILKKLKDMGDLAGFIKGIHLNSSVTGAYVKSQLNNRSIFGEKDFFKRYRDSYLHVLNIDRHVPFESTSIRKVLDVVKPEFLVYEFLTDNIRTLEKYAEVQNRALGL